MKLTILALSLAMALAGCMTDGGPGGSSFFECNRGTMLAVTYKDRTASVRVDGARRPIVMRARPGVDGMNYAGRGWNLRVTGDTASWWGMTREAPQTCRRVRVPR